MIISVQTDGHNALQDTFFTKKLYANLVKHIFTHTQTSHGAAYLKTKSIPNHFMAKYKKLQREREIKSSKDKRYVFS